MKCVYCDKDLSDPALLLAVDYTQHDMYDELICRKCISPSPDDWPMVVKEGMDGTFRSHWEMEELTPWRMDAMHVKLLQRQGLLTDEGIREYFPHLKKHIPYPHERLKSALRSRLHSCLKRKEGNTMDFVGCPLPQLQAHLEDLFTENMTWDNYGEWHVDHIKPCASFDFTDDEEVKKCFHYTNLQPLWAKDNLSKGAKY